MLLHEVKPLHPRKARKTRVGRGGKRGTTSGRGTKGQKSRAGRRIRPAERDLILRLPKLRGFKNPPVSVKPRIINVGDLEARLGNERVVSKKTLAKAGLTDRSSRRPVKILGKGKVTKAFVVKGIPLSGEARKKIEAAQGTVNVS